MAEDHRKFDVGLPTSKNWKHTLWDFVLDVAVRTQNCEARLHAVERISVEGTNPPSQFIPIRFVPTNKCKHPVKLSITHNFGSDSGSQPDVGQAR